ncbi:STAS domain protein [Pseudomonas sp. SCT]|uniref:Anti-anti-sigma regulatory factor (Antagonist of anti-sigma factor) n=1 Tax=Stutzerimonas stutzeri RCH2 TaxID=644801 RepID=L0GGW3_STUST|nr:MULTISPECIES: STAS domain-containing protein [Pseudomonadaceae]AGA85256.1 anti-anti-sigma regulatory factor (antagonist of anti-sigma factor) [Stutzerimonas stutzeri RCH2]GCA54469.1 STAS domain protein [Pseudomonas sp. SCT]
MFTLQQQASAVGTCLALSGNLTIYEVRDARDALLGAFGAQPSGHWQLDLSALDELDTAGAQLLLAAQRQLRLSDATLEVCNPSAEALELLQLLRVQTLFSSHAPAASGGRHAQ